MIHKESEVDEGSAAAPRRIDYISALLSTRPWLVCP